MGVISNAWYNEKDGWYWCDGVIWDETAQNLVQNKGWSVSCSYDFLEQDDEGGTENNIPYDREFTKLNFVHLALVDNPRYERANIVFNSKTVENFNPNQPRVPKGNSNGGQFAGKNKYLNVSKKPIENFYDLHRNLAEPMPEKYTGDATFKAVLAHLGSKDDRSAIIETPAEKVIFNRNNLNHIIIDHPERLKDLNKMVRTLQAPNLIINEAKGGKDYNYYIKNFNEGKKNKAQFEVVKIAPDGNFFSTSYPLNSSKFTHIINGGQIIFDLTHDTTAIQKNVSVINIITDNQEDFNPDITKHEINNSKGADMALLDQLKEFIHNVENGKGENMTQKERIMRILNSKEIDEDTKKAIENELDKKDEESEKSEEKEEKGEKEDKTADNVKNETEKDKEKVEELKKDVKKDTENQKTCDNSVENAKGGFFDNMNKIYNSVTPAPKQPEYVSQADRLKAAEEYFKK